MYLIVPLGEGEEGEDGTELIRLSDDLDVGLLRYDTFRAYYAHNSQYRI